MIVFRISVCLLATSLLFCTAEATAHMAFKKTLSKKFPDMNVNCNACHIDKKPKTERNEFGKLFAKELKEKNLSAQFKAKSAADRKDFEKEVMIPEFTKALEKIKKTKVGETDQTYDERIKAGEIAGIKKKPESKPAGDDGETRR